MDGVDGLLPNGGAELPGGELGPFDELFPNDGPPGEEGSEGDGDDVDDGGGKKLVAPFPSFETGSTELFAAGLAGRSGTKATSSRPGKTFIAITAISSPATINPPIDKATIIGVRDSFGRHNWPGVAMG